MVEMQVASAYGASRDPQYNIVVLEGSGFWRFDCEKNGLKSTHIA